MSQTSPYKCTFTLTMTRIWKNFSSKELETLWFDFSEQLVSFSG